MARLAVRLFVIVTAFAVSSPSSNGQVERVVEVLTQDAITIRTKHFIDALWLPSDAIIKQDDTVGLIHHRRSVYADGSVSVGFRIKTDREYLSRDLIAHFDRLGWRQRKTQFMNPRMATSFDEGWRHRCACVLTLGPDGKPVPRGELSEWTGEWENRSGDVASYQLLAEDDLVSGYASVTLAQHVRRFSAHVAR